jgi:uncharacterized protein YjbI with pentapeptide repeats
MPTCSFNGARSTFLPADSPNSPVPPPGCQYNVPDSQLVDFAGDKWCLFHLPIRTPDGFPSPKAHWTDDMKKSFNDGVLKRIYAPINRISDLSGTVFPADIEFPELLPRMYFDHAEFAGTAKFMGTIHDDVSFQNVKFRGDALFGHVTFKRIVDFRDCKFFKRANFLKSTFRSLYFYNSIFHAEAEFHFAGFGGEVAFRKTYFLSGANFLKSTFTHAPSFSTCVFFGNADFTEANFNQGALFHGTSFVTWTSFSKCRFGSRADFSGDIVFAKPLSSLLRAQATEDVEIDFGAFGPISFDSAIFDQKVTFENRTFQRATNFRHVTFRVAPSFHGCRLHQDTDFTSAKFLDTRSATAARAYRTLKLAMEQHSAGIEQAMFHALELKSTRHQPETSRAVKFVSWCYEKCSNYGQSIIRPAAITLLIPLAFSVVYGLLIYFWSGPSIVKYADMVAFGEEALIFSAKQVFRPFDVLAARNTGIEGPSTSHLHALVESVPNWKTLLVITLAVFESLLEITTAALLVLAIRRRFKISS